MIQLIGKIRRLWLVYVRRDYVREQLARRHGRCEQCGACCRLAWRCAMLRDDMLCRAYGVCRDQVCKLFPIDERDLRDAELSGSNCGYWFDPPRRKRPATSR